MTTPDPDIAAIAEGLSEGAKRALMKMTGEWQFPGRSTFDANGAWALRWARGTGGRVLCEREVQAAENRRGKRAAYRIASLGIAVRDHILRSGR